MELVTKLIRPGNYFDRENFLRQRVYSIFLTGNKHFRILIHVHVL